jgi:hypothetical protein
MRLDIDLNKLSKEELKFVVAIMDNAEVKEKPMPVVKFVSQPSPVVAKQKVKWSRKSISKYQKRKRVHEAIKRMKATGESFKKAFRTLTGNKTIASEYLKIYNNIQSGRGKAGGLARKLKAAKSFQMANFPVIEGVSPAMQNVLKDMTKHLLGDSNLKLTKEMEGNILLIENWGDFLVSFMNKSKDISSYFGVANKFKISDGSIVYR